MSHAASSTIKASCSSISVSADGPKTSSSETSDQCSKPGYLKYRIKNTIRATTAVHIVCKHASFALLQWAQWL